MRVPPIPPRGHGPTIGHRPSKPCDAGLNPAVRTTRADSLRRRAGCNPTFEGLIPSRLSKDFGGALPLEPNKQTMQVQILPPI